MDTTSTIVLIVVLLAIAGAAFLYINKKKNRVAAQPVATVEPAQVVPVVIEPTVSPGPQPITDVSARERRIIEIFAANGDEFRSPAQSGRGAGDPSTKSFEAAADRGILEVGSCAITGKRGFRVSRRVNLNAY